MDEYVAFMQQYNENPTDAQLLAQYADIMQRYAYFAEKCEAYDSDTMSQADASYYLEVQSRVLNKLASVQ